MIRSIIIIAACFLLALAFVALGQQVAVPPPMPPGNEPKTPYGLTNQDALRALRQMDDAKKQARVTYTRALEPARNRLITSLTTVQNKLTKEGNLDEAVKLKTAISDLKQQGDEPEVSASLLRLLPETQWKQDKGWVLTFHSDMTVTSTHHSFKGCWVPISADTVRVSLSMESCSSRVLRISRDGHMSDIESKEPYNFTAVKGK